MLGYWTNVANEANCLSLCFPLSALSLLYSSLKTRFTGFFLATLSWYWNWLIAEFVLKRQIFPRFLILAEFLLRIVFVHCLFSSGCACCWSCFCFYSFSCYTSVWYFMFHLKPSVAVRSLVKNTIGPLQFMITWYKKHLASGQITHWDPKQKNVKLSCFVLDVPVGNLLSDKVFFVPCDRKL